MREDELPGQVKGQVAYGEKIRNGKIVPHLGELRIVGELVSMRKQGLSYGKLVKWLNQNEVPTKNRSKVWDRPTVYKILKRHSVVRESC